MAQQKSELPLHYDFRTAVRDHWKNPKQISEEIALRIQEANPGADNRSRGDRQSHTHFLLRDAALLGYFYGAAKTPEEFFAKIEAENAERAK